MHLPHRQHTSIRADGNLPTSHPSRNHALTRQKGCNTEDIGNPQVDSERVFRNGVRI